MTDMDGVSVCYGTDPRSLSIASTLSSLVSFPTASGHGCETIGWAKTSNYGNAAGSLSDRAKLQPMPKAYTRNKSPTG